MVNRRRVNNAGWINDQSYRPDDQTPLLAIVGGLLRRGADGALCADNSYGRLAKKLAGQLRVYSFGASGAPFGQYLIWARHAVREYGARAVVINLVGNDFVESNKFVHPKGPGWWVSHRSRHAE